MLRLTAQFRNFVRSTLHRRESKRARFTVASRKPVLSRDHALDASTQHRIGYQGFFEACTLARFVKPCV